MKVLFYTYPTAFQNPGGGETVLLKTKEYLERQGTTVELFDQWKTRIGEYDLVHSFTWYTSLMWPHFKQYGCRVVVTPISWFYVGWPSLLRARLKYRILDLLHGPHASYDEKNYRCPDLFLPNSQGEAIRLTRRFGIEPARMRLVPHGVDVSFLNGTPALFRERYGVSDFILCVGRFVEAHKNQIGLIRALKGQLDVPTVFIGSPDARDTEYYERCRREADERCLFIDALPHGSPLLASAYKAAKVLVVPSFLEAPGLVALEGGLAGTNVVVTERGATREYFGDRVDYVDPYVPASILAGVRRALSRPRGDRLVAHILDNYTWERIARETFDAYESVL